ncbi:hypothetical protein GGS20DRAFT_458746 [Poronia punctata]|nr:hypothetical protein GGS20DRAFT_458746 [Poronia punctata]
MPSKNTTKGKNFFYYNMEHINHLADKVWEECIRKFNDYEEDPIPHTDVIDDSLKAVTEQEINRQSGDEYLTEKNGVPDRSGYVARWANAIRRYKEDEKRNSNTTVVVVVVDPIPIPIPPRDKTCTCALLKKMGHYVKIALGGGYKRLGIYARVDLYDDDHRHRPDPDPDPETFTDLNLENKRAEDFSNRGDWGYYHCAPKLY